MNEACNVKLFLALSPGALGRGQKVKYHLISSTKSISKIFYTRLCVLTNERYKKYQTGFSFCRLGHATGVGLWAVGGCPGGKKKSNMVMWAYQIDRDVEQKRMQIKFLSWGQTGDFGVRSKGDDNHVSSKFLIPNFVCILTNKR